MPRIDRLAALYLFFPLLKTLACADNKRTPILMYHSVSNSEDSGKHPYYNVNTTPRIFAEHMRFLYDNNYRAISLDEAVRRISCRARDSVEAGQQKSFQSEKAVVITFDDGFLDFYTDAFPILTAHKFTATVFLPTAFIGSKRIRFKEKECLGWADVKDLHNNGISFGSHTVNHPQLKSLGKSEIEYELRRSKETIEDKLGAPVRSFSYPFAFPEDRSFQAFLSDTLKKYEYECGVSTRVGADNSAADIFSLKRIPANSCDDPAFFEAKLCGAYDWLYYAQYLSKLVRRK